MGYLVAALCICIGFYLVSPFTDDWGWAYLTATAQLAGNLIPALVWLLARAFFVDSKRIPAIFFIVLFIYLPLILMPAGIQHALVSDPENQQLVFFFTPQLIKLGLAIHVIFLALMGKNGDLVERRLQLRVPFAVVLASITAIVISIEIGFGNDVPGQVETPGSGLLFLLTFGGTLWGMRLRPELAATVNFISAHKDAPKDIRPDPAIDKIMQMMGSERFYANDKVTLDVMAQQLALPPYKLRPIINKQMGFRNFNQFLNSYRIAEASQQLLSYRSMPILSIALDVGFNSLSSFNKAFKDTHAMTPSEFRRRNA